MVQAALRGRPLEHPDTHITILASLPLPGLSPTILCPAPSSLRSNPGREHATIDRLLVATQHLLGTGARVLDAPIIARSAGVSVVTVRRHWETIASRLHLHSRKHRRWHTMPRGGQRQQIRAVLVRRGRLAPPSLPTTQRELASTPPRPPMPDQARNRESVTRLILRSLASRCRSRPFAKKRRHRHWQPPARAPG
jgi:hypothetical protein